MYRMQVECALLGLGFEPGLDLSPPVFFNAFGTAILFVSSRFHLQSRLFSGF